MLAAGIVSACSTPPLRPNGLVTLAPGGRLPGVPARVVAVGTVPGPAAPATTQLVRRACPSGMTVSGGGIATTLIGGAQPPSSLHADGTAPAGATGHAPAGSGSVPAGWMALGAAGGQPVVGGATTSYTMCLRGMALRRPKVVLATVPGPAVAATTARATAACPADARLVGGGGLATVTTGSASPSLHLIGSYPSDARGTAVNDATRDPAAWSAVADAGGRTGSGVETSAFALCVPAPGAHTEIARATKSGPLPPGTATAITADCRGATELVSGGADTGPGSGPPQQGLHLTGSFPSDSAGAGVGASSAADGAESWTARAESGGQGSPAGTVTTAYAVCLRP